MKEKCNYCGRSKSAKTEHSCRTKRKFGHIANLITDIKELINQQHSVLHISNESVKLFGTFLSHTQVRQICKANDIKTPNISESKLSPVTQQVLQRTLHEKYGIDASNISQIPLIKNIKREVNLERYGVENQFQREAIKEKSRNTLFQHYGVYHSIHIPDRKFHTGRLSTPHKKVSNYLTEIGVEHVNDKPGSFSAFNEKMGRVYCPIPDIFIPEKKIVIEVYGDYWHMNPSMFYPSDMIRGFTGLRTAKETWDYDETRLLHIKGFGVKILVLWENDINTQFDYVKQLIQDIL